jgi:hypothetical protein
LTRERRGREREPEAVHVGLCGHCRHTRKQPNPRGQVFWRCGASERDASLLRYPPLPVLRCHAFERALPGPDEPRGRDPESRARR